MEELSQESGKRLNIRMLGELSVIKDGKDMTTHLRQSPNLIRTFCYLVAMNGKSVLPEDLIWEVLSDKEYANPARVMQNTVYRLRKLLDTDGTAGCIRTVGRYYSWHGEANYSLDTKTFEAAADAVLSNCKCGVPDVVALQNTIELYTDNFLSDMLYEQWTISIRETLKNKYMSCVHKLLNFYSKTENNTGIIELCKKVLTIEPYCEMVHVYYMEALVAEQRIALAMQHYYQFILPIFKTLGIEPSAELQVVFERVQNKRMLPDLDVKALISRAWEKTNVNGPIVCDYDVFCQHCQIKKSIGRPGVGHHLVVFSIKQQDYSVLSSKTQTIARKAMLNTLRRTLRAGDVISILNDGRIFVLLSNIKIGITQMVIDRVLKHFGEESISQSVKLHYMHSPFQGEVLPMVQLFKFG